VEIGMRQRVAERIALRVADAVVALVMTFLIVAPIGILTLLAVTEEWGRSFSGKLTLQWLLDVPSQFGQPFLHSLFVASAATLMTCAMAVLVAFAVVTKRVRATALLDAIVMAPLSLSYVVLGLAMIVAFNRPPFALHGTITLLVIGHTMICLPLAYRIVHSVVGAMDVGLVEAARGLGATDLIILRWVILPLVSPAIVAAGLLAFVTSLQNYALSLMIAPDNFKTVPLELFAWLFAETGGYSNYNLAAAISLYLMAIILAAVAAVRVFARQSWFENMNI
jgi:2-aminoethylphosphonate transport system permease protein